MEQYLEAVSTLNHRTYESLEKGDASQPLGLCPIFLIEFIQALQFITAQSTTIFAIPILPK